MKMSIEIRNNLVYLTDNLSNLRGILIHLIQDGIISSHDKEEIESEKTSFDKNDKLLSLILKKDWSKVRDTFVEILRQTNNEYCADRIEATVANEIEAKEDQATRSKRAKIENDCKKPTKEITNVSKCDKISKWWPDIEGKESEATGSKSNRSTNNQTNVEFASKCEKIPKWWPEEKRLIQSLHQRKFGDKILVEELHNRIQKDINRMVVICESAEANKFSGMGGIGKTLTAKWYAHHYEEYYDHILWIDCGEGSLIKSFKNLARDLEVKNRNELLEVEEFSRKCFESLFECRCLWIYDNAEKYKGEGGVINVLPNHRRFFCLITSRSREWGVENIGYGKISELQLEIFSQEESLEFLNTKLKKEIKSTEFELNEMCRLLGNLPLALQLAVAALNSSDMDVKTYITKSKFVKVLDKQSDDYERTINGNVNVSLDLIKKEEFGSTANEILMVFGYIRSDDIQLEFFKSALQIHDDREVKKSVKLLTKYSLVAKTKIISSWSAENKIVLSIHRLLQQVIRYNGKEKEREILRKILGCEGFIDYKLQPFTKYADDNVKKEFPKVKAELLDQQKLNRWKLEERYDDCVQLAKLIDQELKGHETKLNYAICLYDNQQFEECVGTTAELLTKIPFMVNDNQFSRVMVKMIIYLKRIKLRAHIKRSYHLVNVTDENMEKLREKIGDLLLFSYLRLEKFDEAIGIGKIAANRKQVSAILIQAMKEKRFNDCVELAKIIDQELATNTTKLNYAICLYKNGQYEECVITLEELYDQEMKEEIKYQYHDDVEMGLLKLDKETSRELVGGHLLLAYWTMNDKAKVVEILEKRNGFKIIYSKKSLAILIRLVHSEVINCKYSLAKELNSFIDLKLDVQINEIYLKDCSLSLDSFDRLSPEGLFLLDVSFFRDGQELEKTVLNDFVDFFSIKHLKIICGRNKKNVIVDVSGDVFVDYLELWNVAMLNWNICHWDVQKLVLGEIPLVEKTSIRIKELIIGSSLLDVSCLSQNIQKLTIRGMKEVFVGGAVELPNLNHLTLKNMLDIECLSHFRAVSLTHIHLDDIYGEVNVDLLPPTLSYLQIVYGHIRVIGGKRKIDKLRLEHFSFDRMKNLEDWLSLCLSHLHTHDLLIHSFNGIEANQLVELMNKQINTIAIGRIKWDKDEFKNYASQLDRKEEFYLLERGKGKAMEWDEFEELLKVDYTSYYRYNNFNSISQMWEPGNSSPSGTV